MDGHETCDCCGGELAWLGQLGCLIWLVCINCGMQFSVKE